MSWQVWICADGYRHVVPKDDMRPHRHSIDCWCRPKIFEDYPVISHNAMDEREKAEEAVKQ